MKHIVAIVVLSLSLLSLPVFSVKASSQQAYQDYQYQFSIYRQRLSDYQVALNQYKQFKSLASQQDVLEKVKLYIAQRGNVAKTYFLFLNEKITENPGMIASEKQTYRAILTNQIAYIDQHLVLAPSIASLDDAQKVSEKFESNYDVMQSAYRQIIGALELGYLDYFSRQFDEVAVHAQALINASRIDSSPQKQAILDRWLLALSNKHTLFQQKANTIRSTIPKITGDVQQQERIFQQLQSSVNAARQDLLESAAYLKELETALKYD